MLRFIDGDVHDGSLTFLIRVQVLSNSAIATVLVVVIWTLTGWKDECLDSGKSALITSLIGGVIGHYCCCNGDTWSSELGILSDEQPRLITTFKVCTFCSFSLCPLHCGSLPLRVGVYHHYPLQF